MKIKARKNPTTCLGLSTLLGYPVLSWAQHTDGTEEVDLDADLSPDEVLKVMVRLEVSKVHLTDGETDTILQWREKWGAATSTQAKLKVLAERIGLE